ncbi:MAG TPA: hypothetical protein VGV92_09150 [Gammaproteobacteria bacterium]|nr:hypothetical protein [Gammaproteobacteria bacterium]
METKEAISKKRRIKVEEDPADVFAAKENEAFENFQNAYFESTLAKLKQAKKEVTALKEEGIAAFEAWEEEERSKLTK